ncbi:MAG: DUF2723 domain-containing protein [Candidatus Marinimicrobia bacterium]|nr:DUF2723 domain-containing protein [Candidatus Neomarinimicrobiota bacterium]
MIQALKNNLNFFLNYSLALERFLATLVFFITFAVYFSTMAPTVSFWDTGEFIATSHILGIPHPPGSPLFLLIGKLFTLIPISSDIAFRMNIFSPLISAATISLLFLICNQFIDRLDSKDDVKHFKMWSSLTASLTFAFTHSHWFNAVETEVYALSGFMTALVVYLILMWSKYKEKEHSTMYLMGIVYVIGLATGVHLLNLLTIPFIGLIIYFSTSNFSTKNLIVTLSLSLLTFIVIQNVIIKGFPTIVSKIGFEGLLLLMGTLFYFLYSSIKNKKTISSLIYTSLFLIIIGYSTYLTIFIRSGQNPNIDENNPETIIEATSYLNRDQYGSMSLLPRKFNNLPSKISVVGSPEYPDFEFSSRQDYNYMTYNISEQASFLWAYQINKMYIRYFLWQFAGKGPSNDSFVSDFGALPKQDGVDWRQFGLPLALIMGLFGAYFHFRKNKYDAFSLLVLFIMTGIAIIFYLNQDNPQARERDYSYVASFMTFAIWISIGIFNTINYISDTLLEKSIKLKASYFMISMFLVFIPLRMLIANYDEHDRTGNYIAWDMAYNMLQTCEPNAIFFTNGDNDTFPVWYLQEVEKIRTDVKVVNLSLLNTPWYVTQLRDKDNPFIIMNDNEIKNLDFKRWSTSTISVGAPVDDLNPDGIIEWELQPTYLDVALRIQDLMVLRIIKDNNWNRPVYFAVTVSPTSMLNLDDYLTMEGLAYRLVNNKSYPINQDKMTQNLLPIVGSKSWFEDYDSHKDSIEDLSISQEYQPGYIYRNLANENVHVDRQTGRLIQNYRTGFTRLAISHYLDSNLQKAEMVLLDMEDKMPSSVISMPSKELQYQISQIYNGTGNKEKVKYHLKELTQRDDIEMEDYLLYGRSFIQNLDDYAEAKLIFKTIYDNFLIIEKAIKKQGFTSTKITAQEWQSWQKTLPELVFLLYLCHRELEEYDEATMLIENWIVRSPEDIDAGQLLDEIEKLKGL